MNRFIKTWVLWLLMLSLPLQALASVAQLSCAIGDPQRNGHQRHPAAYVAKSCHAAASKQSPRLKHGGKSAKKAVASATPQQEHAACGPCAMCCGASAALPNLHPMPVPWIDVDSHFALLPASHAGHIPEGLERPPRPSAS